METADWQAGRGTLCSGDFRKWAGKNWMSTAILLERPMSSSALKPANTDDYDEEISSGTSAGIRARRLRRAEARRGTRGVRGVRRRAQVERGAEEVVDVVGEPLERREGRAWGSPPVRSAVHVRHA